MSTFDALGRVPLGSAFLQPADVAPTLPVVVINQWRGLNGTGYCSSVTFQALTVSSIFTTNVVLQVNGFDIMMEQGGLL